MTDSISLRGGSWNHNLWICRSASRYHVEPGLTNDDIGFRVISTATPPVGDRCPVRGGAWYNFPRNCRSATRPLIEPGYSSNSYGFRVVCTAPKHD